MGKTSNEIMEADQRLMATLNETVEIRAELRAREIIEEFTVRSGLFELDVLKIDFENRILDIEAVK